MTTPIVPQSKTCTNCHIEKPVTEFYPRPKGAGLYTSECKDCMKLRSKNQTARAKEWTPKDTGESLVFNKLMSMGIWTAPGRTLKDFPFVDLVAWGCVGIEIKTARQKRSNKYINFGFSPDQIEHGIRGDIIILLDHTSASPRFYVFPARHSAFYRNGILKSVVTITPDRIKSVRKHRGATLSLLTQEILDKHENAWDIIEIARYQKSGEAIKQYG